MELDVQQVTKAGIDPTFSPADVDGDTFRNNGDVVLNVRNNDTVLHKVTIDSAKPCNYGFDHDLTVDVPAGEGRMIGPFDPARFNGAGDAVSITYDGATSVEVAAIRV